MRQPSKAERLKAIRDLVASTPIETQAELAAALRSRGYEVAQATISRDIHELGLVKRLTNDGRSVYALPQEGTLEPGTRLSHLLPEIFRGVAAAQNLVVLHTLPGNAHAVGSILDAIGWEEVLGTICGDDTCLLVCRDSKGAEMVCQRLEHYASTS
ncbi:MAG: arginine repressor [Firmicutes bacterium]|nr:arginine repressor [Bacillota bacterium]